VCGIREIYFISSWSSESDEECTEFNRKPAAKDTMDPEKPPNAPRRQDYLWEMKGDFLVIRVPFWRGDHIASKPSDFAPIIQFLQNLHGQMLFHGDIRCFNMIFSEHGGKCTGKLIDFDFGGRASKRHYPSGYVADLPDGCRLGESMELIEEYHEWFALAHCMFVCHQFQTKEDAFYLQILRFPREIQSSAETPEGLIACIRKISRFLTDTETKEWECTYHGRFEQTLEKMVGAHTILQKEDHVS
jgi:hypothetical protein